VFTVRLVHAQAVAPGVEAAGTAPSPLTASSGAAPRRLLVIEDNPSNLALMRAIVARRPQWQLAAARDAVAGLACAHEQRPELIVLDLHLPGLSGESVLATLKQEPGLRDIPVVIISADTLPETSARLLAAGAQDYLTKPLDVARFLATLDGAAA
jgi:CheY-like chemotaxis protein